MIIYFGFEHIHWVYETFTYNCEVFILKIEDEIVWKRRTGMEYTTYKGNKKTEASENMHDLSNLSYRHNIAQCMSERSNISSLFLTFKE
jgi:hypothetical protein